MAGSQPWYGGTALNGCLPGGAEPCTDTSCACAVLTARRSHQRSCLRQLRAAIDGLDAIALVKVREDRAHRQAPGPVLPHTDYVS